MEYAALAEAYAGHTPGTVQYVRLINYLEQAFVVPDMERFPTSTVPPLAASSIRKPLPTLGDAQEEEVAALLQRIRRQVTVHRLEVKQPFDDFARGSGLIHRVTRSQFRQVRAYAPPSAAACLHCCCPAGCCRRLLDRTQARPSFGTPLWGPARPHGPT